MEHAAIGHLKAVVVDRLAIMTNAGFASDYLSGLRGTEPRLNGPRLELYGIFNSCAKEAHHKASARLK